MSTDDIWRTARDGALRPSVLLVDDEPSVLDSLRRQLHSQYKVVTATDGAAGLELLRRDGPFAVVVSDMRMPGMDGADFLARAERTARDTTRVLLTGQADVRTAAAAINQGRVFRFLRKPCPINDLRQCLRDAAEQHRLLNAERDLLERTLRGVVAALFGCLELASPQGFARAARIRSVVVGACGQLDVTDSWEIDVAASLSQLGAVTLPPGVLERLDRGHRLSEQEQAMVDRMPEVAARIIDDIPRLGAVAAIIRGQAAPPAGDQPDDVVALGAELLRAAIGLEAREARGATPAEAIAALEREGLHRRPHIVAALRRLHHVVAETESVKLLPAAELVVGMRIVEDVYAVNGAVLIGRGAVITEALLDRLDNIRAQGNLVEPITAAVTESPAAAAPPAGLGRGEESGSGRDTGPEPGDEPAGGRRRHGLLWRFR